MIDWDTYSELYRRLFITTLQPTREGAQQQLPAQTWNGNFVLDRDWSLELCAAVWQPSSCTPRVQIDKTPQQAPSLSCAGAGQTAVNQIWASEDRRERERGEAGDKQRNLNSKLRAAEEGPSRTLARGAGTSIRLILILQQQAVPHLRGNMSYYTGHTQYSAVLHRVHFCNYARYSTLMDTVKLQDDDRELVASWLRAAISEKNGKEAPVWGVAQFWEMSHPGS